LPLSERARIEIYLPDLPRPAYARLLERLEREVTYAVGGCTIVRGLSGSYLSTEGRIVPDRVNLIYTDIAFSLAEDLPLISQYADELRDSAFQALDEEAILVAVHAVYHAE
jgi:hypothetical protein